MNPTTASAAWPACHSALRLDRWLLHELPDDEAAALAAHVPGCDACREAAAALADARDRAALPPLRQPHPPPRQRPMARRPVALATAVAALAAALVAVVVGVRPGADPLRSKGGEQPDLAMYVQHGGEVRRASLDERVAPGDAVRFAVTLHRPYYVAILSLDPLGHASVYYPTGPRAERVEPGPEAALPLATRLDASLGRERIFGLFCDAPLALEPVRAQLDAVAAGLVPPGCQVTRWTFEKR